MTPRALTEDGYRFRSGDVPPRRRPRCRRRRSAAREAMARGPGALSVFIIDRAPNEGTPAVVMVTGHPAMHDDFPMTARRDAAEARGAHADQM